MVWVNMQKTADNESAGMKKTDKAPKKPNSRRKRHSTSVKTSARRRKAILSDAFRAFLLAGVITVFAAAISLAIITVHSRLKSPPAPVAVTKSLPYIAVENDTEKAAAAAQEIEENSRIPAAEPLVPVISVSVSDGNNRPVVTAPVVAAVQPAKETAAPVLPARANPAVNTVPASFAQRPPERPAQNTGTLVFVIDDAGNNLRELEPFLRVPGPLTIAVLPGLPYSAEAARRIRAAGKEVILHQPMEAIGAQNPGPGAIYSGMGEDEIRSILTRNIAEIGPVAGINNHQGSKISMDTEIVEIVLTFCAERGLFFLDSRTIAQTVIPSAARRLGMKIAERDVFIDNEQDKDTMLRYITDGLARAQKNGSSVMIGHVWSPELAPLLAEQFPLLTGRGYSIKTASDIIK
jgi:polysaccharide deacetylase 2 family uncharacterized protein YibQ